MPRRSRAGSTTRRRTHWRSGPRSNTPPGRRCRRRAQAGTSAASCSGCRTGSTCIIWCRSRRSSATASRCCACRRTHWRARDGFGLTDPGTDLAGRAGRGQLLHLVPQPAEGQLPQRAARQGRRLPQEHLRRDPRRLPARREDLRDEPRQVARHIRSARLAIVAVDNPLCAATGHRICNDCMKACIYQRQDPVDIPQIETRTLKDVLGLPWGFEIYSLLTRWNPLDLRRPLPKPPSGYKVLVVGLGPAGFNLAHHLINDGHFVAAIDGLKIEPLPPRSAGVALDRRARPVRAGPRCRQPLRAARRAHDGRVRRRRRIRHHGALGQEFPQADPAAAGAPRRSSRCMAGCASAAR